MLFFRRGAYFLLTLLVTAFIGSCENPPVNAPNTFSVPQTQLVVDTVRTIQTTTVRFQWSGTVSDGIVGGFFVSINGRQWGYTTKQDSTFLLPIFSADTTFTISVAACRPDGGNGVWDSALVRGTINFGPEPFVDLDSSRRYRLGEPFTDIGLIDTSPATVNLRVRNSPPTLQALRVPALVASQTTFSTQLPDTTYPAAEVRLLLTDLDGARNLSRLEITLNDSAFASGNIVTVPINTLSIAPTFNITLALEAVNPRQRNGTTQALVYLNSNPTALPQRLSNYRLDNQNIIYARVVDATQAVSRRIQIPDTLSWYTQSVSSTLCVIDNYSQGNDPLRSTDTTVGVLRPILQSLVNGKYTGANQYQTLTLAAQSSDPLALFRRARMYRDSPFILQRTLNFFNLYLWYCDSFNNSLTEVPRITLAAAVLPTLLGQGKKALMITAFAGGSIPSESEIQFSPSNVMRQLFPANVNNDTLRVLDANYPSLLYRVAGVTGAGEYSPAAMGLQASPDIQPMYRINRPIAGVGSDSTIACARRIYRSGAQETGRLIFTSIGFYGNFNQSLGGNNTLFRFYDTVFRREFGEQ
jgi:hypothetical protein